MKVKDHKNQMKEKEPRKKAKKIKVMKLKRQMQIIRND